ncbi:MAG: hypothetical protein WBS20_16925 [Lysobacterales bacterium]
MRKQSIHGKQNGFSILEVVIGIFIFVVGMLALASLQGALTRSMADSKARTAAVNLAEQELESQRGFTILTTDPAGVLHAYNDIVSQDRTVNDNGVAYAIDMNVTDFYYHLDTGTFTDVSTGGLNSDYKQVEVIVTWDALQGFRDVEGTERDLQSGQIKLTGSIPAIVTSASGRLADETEGGVKITPPILYTPGQNPDIVALQVGDSKFKESLLPEPDVIRRDELVQTTFDVITYSQDGDQNSFLRREEFAAVSCECEYHDADASNPGRRPYIWAGDEYAGGQLVTKPYGTSANNQQSSLCDTCCRDHHDGPTGLPGDSNDAYANVYGPFKGDGEYVGTARASDHKHYQDDATTLALDGDDYLEACRLVRVDGFWKVAQDFRREDQYIFPADFLDNDATELMTYSDYVTGAAEAYTDAAIAYTANSYPAKPIRPCIGAPGCEAVPAMQGAYSDARIDGELPSWTQLETNGIEEQQLRSRGIYIDYMSKDLRLFLDQCFSSGTLVNDCCIRGGVVANACTGDDLYIDKTPTADPLEVVPFFEVQLTKLENWDQTIQATLPISLTNEALADANAHSRGEIAQVALGVTDVSSHSQRGNIGFTNTLAIDPVFETKSGYLNVQSLDASGSGGGGGGNPPRIIAGTFTESVQGSPKIKVVGTGGATCTLEPKGYTCSVADGATSAGLTVFGYGDSKGVETRYACSSTLTASHSNSSNVNASTTFNLFISGVLIDAGTNYDIQITTTSC